MRLVFLFLFFLINNTLFSQIIFEKTSHDFGSLSLTSERFVDIIVTNKTPKKEYLLSVKKPPNVVYLVNGQFMEKDGSLIIRLQVNPKNKGRFSYEVEIYTSDKDKPTIIKLTGNLTEEMTHQSNSFQACPDFNAKPNPQNATSFELTIVTVDKNSRELLASSSVSIIQNGRPQDILFTNKKGEIKQKIPLGFTYFYATHEGYLPKELGSYVNFQRNYVVLELEKNKASEQSQITNKQPIEVDQTPKEIEKTLEKQLEKELPIAINTIPTSNKYIPFEDLDKNNFDATHFKPINVTFILDVSASMRVGEKMELMKFSLYQLTDMLRQQDKISIITYSTDTKIVLPPTSGTEKEEIKKLIEELGAGGLTAGGSGIKLGYKQNLKSFIANGTNQIIIITDGAFNRNSDDYKKHIKRYKKKGINMTVVGVLNNEKDKVAMQEAAELGGGRYIPIAKLADAMNNLKQEIRLISFIR